MTASARNTAPQFASRSMSAWSHVGHDSRTTDQYVARSGLADMRNEGVATWARSTAGTASPASAQSNATRDRKSTRLNSRHGYISYAVFCLKKKKKNRYNMMRE